MTNEREDSANPGDVNIHLMGRGPTLMDRIHLVSQIIANVAWATFLAMLVGFALTTATDRAKADTSFPGPYFASVIKVIDGDTLRAEIYGFPGVVLMRDIRVKGIDTPETRNLQCPDDFKAKEKALGQRATGFVRERYPVGTLFQIRDVEDEKYGGRVAAIVERVSEDGPLRLDIELIAAGLGDPYGINHPDGRKHRFKKLLSWCVE